METLYDILEVSRKASKEVIDKAYKTLAKKYHPDLQPNEQKKYAEEMMKKINEAYAVLSDDVKRSEYDRKLQEQQRVNNVAQGTQNINYNPTYRSYNMSENDTRQEYSKLSKKEQKKIAKKIQKKAQEEYRREYEKYFRSLGYSVQHKWTFKDSMILLILILILLTIFFILWLIPPTHEWMINLYNDNFIIRIIVNIIIRIYKTIVDLFPKHAR